MLEVTRIEVTEMKHVDGDDVLIAKFGVQLGHLRWDRDFKTTEKMAMMLREVMQLPAQRVEKTKHPLRRDGGDYHAIVCLAVSHEG